MVIGIVGQLGNKQALDVDLVLIINDEDGVVALVESVSSGPNAAVDVPEPEYSDNLPHIVHHRAHQDQLAVAHALLPHQLYQLLAHLGEHCLLFLPQPQPQPQAQPLLYLLQR